MKAKKSETRLKELLKGTGMTISAAESCTGGMISHLITTVPGSSEYFLGTVVSYSPDIKTKILGVSPEIIADKGIVSSDVALSMAENVRTLTGSTFSVATTGWADSYGDEHEPAGTVWIAVSGPNGSKSFRFQNSGSRKANIRQFANKALLYLEEYIKP